MHDCEFCSGGLWKCLSQASERGKVHLRSRVAVDDAYCPFVTRRPIACVLLSARVCGFCMGRATTKPIFIIIVTLILSSLLVLAALISPGASSRAAINAGEKSAVPAGDTKPAAPAGVVTTAAGSTYTASKGEPLAAVVRRYWPETSYLTRAEMDTALREANHLGKAAYLKAC